jgi:hypothetical protein
VVRCVGGLAKVLGTRERLAAKAAGGWRDMSVREQWPDRGVHPYHFTASTLVDVLWSIYRRHHRELHPDVDLAVWGDKLPRYYEDFEALAALRVPVKYVHLSRNPFDVVNSMLRRTRMAREGKDWWKAVTDPEQMIDTWNAAFARIRELEARDDVLHLQYEDMVFEAEATVARLREFLGFDLAVAFDLVDEPAAHFERTDLDDELRRLVQRRADVKGYADHLRRTGAGRVSLEHLEL